MKRTLIEVPDRGGDRPVPDCGHPVDRAPIGGLVAGESVDCQHCDRRLIPSVTTIGRRTPTFTPDSVPPALLRDHRTTAWAELIVVAGTVDFEQQEPPFRATAAVGRPVVIVPGVAHRVAPGAGAEFHVQFHDLPPGFRPAGSRPDQPVPAGTEQTNRQPLGTEPTKRQPAGTDQRDGTGA